MYCLIKKAKNNINIGGKEYETKNIFIYNNSNAVLIVFLQAHARRQFIGYSGYRGRYSGK